MRRFFLLAVIGILFAVNDAVTTTTTSLATTSATPPPTLPAPNCLDCITTGGQWCFETNECVMYESQCPGCATTMSCGMNCTALTSCTQCTNSRCRWCPTTSTCHYVGVSSKCNQCCGGVDFYTGCVDCYALATCSSCMKTFSLSCVWCASTGQCVPSVFVGGAAGLPDYIACEGCPRTIEPSNNTVVVITPTGEQVRREESGSSDSSSSSNSVSLLRSEKGDIKEKSIQQIGQSAVNEPDPNIEVFSCQISPSSSPQPSPGGAEPTMCAASVCSLWSNCNGCTTAGCVWCGSTQKCLDSANITTMLQFSPYPFFSYSNANLLEQIIYYNISAASSVVCGNPMNTCNSTCVHVNPNSCPTVSSCSSITSADQCVQAQCAWCISTGQCFETQFDSIVTNTHFCSSPSSPPSCPSVSCVVAGIVPSTVSCSQFTDCTACAAASCAWCDSKKQCLNTNANGVLCSDISCSISQEDPFGPIFSVALCGNRNGRKSGVVIFVVIFSIIGIILTAFVAATCALKNRALLRRTPLLGDHPMSQMQHSLLKEDEKATSS